MLGGDIKRLFISRPNDDDSLLLLAALAQQILQVQRTDDDVPFLVARRLPLPAPTDNGKHERAMRGCLVEQDLVQ